MESSLLKVQRRLLIGVVFFVVLAILPFTPEPAIDIKVLGYGLCAFAALALWLFSPVRTGRHVFHSSGLYALVLLFSGVNLAAALVSPNIGYSLVREFPKLAALSILFVVAAEAFYSPGQVWRLAGAICIAMSMASLYGLLQFMGVDPFPWHDTDKMLRTAPATFGNPNFASHALTPALILAGGLCTQRKGSYGGLLYPSLPFPFCPHSYSWLPVGVSQRHYAHLRGATRFAKSPESLTCHYCDLERSLLGWCVGHCGGRYDLQLGNRPAVSRARKPPLPFVFRGLSYDSGQAVAGSWPRYVSGGQPGVLDTLRGGAIQQPEKDEFPCSQRAS